MKNALNGGLQINNIPDEISETNQIPMDLVMEKGNNTMFNFNNSVYSGKSRQSKKGKPQQMDLIFMLLLY